MFRETSRRFPNPGCDWLNNIWNISNVFNTGWITTDCATSDRRVSAVSLWHNLQAWNILFHLFMHNTVGTLYIKFKHLRDTQARRIPTLFLLDPPPTLTPPPPQPHSNCLSRWGCFCTKRPSTLTSPLNHSLVFLWLYLNIISFANWISLFFYIYLIVPANATPCLINLI